MGRPRKPPGETLIELPCKVPPEVAEEIGHIARVTDRPRSQIARKLIARGLAAYRRDGKLDEPRERVEAGIAAQPLHRKKRERTQNPSAQLKSGTKKRDWIDEALDTAHSFSGKPLSEKTREKIRKILEEEQDKLK